MSTTEAADRLADDNGAGWNLESSYAGLPEAFYTKMNPAPVPSPALVVLNAPLAAALGLDAEALRGEKGAALLSGNGLPPGAKPLAQAYAGHQFGYFTMLGDGRALLLGEQVTPKGERLDIQLKGSGRTPYSRGGDGRAALGPMLREYIISEAMHGLGIPTTRSLAVVTTGKDVIREEVLTGAVLTRVAASHIRVGTFEYAAGQAQQELLQALADYTITRHDPEAAQADHPYRALLKGVIARQARLIAQWQLVGFIHGVMNTDNMTLSGETIDYGPCAFMDKFDPAMVFSSIDSQGRYAYGNQPSIAVWNLARLAEALLPLLAETEEEAVEIAEAALGDFAAAYHANWLGGMRAKLGLFNEEAEDEALVQELLGLMQQHGADYTNTFRMMTLGGCSPKRDDVNESDGASEDKQGRDALGIEGLCGASAFAKWQEKWQARRLRQQENEHAATERMRRSNPAVIARNHRVEAALAAAEQGDLTVMEQLLAVLADPYAYTEDQLAYAEVPAPAERPYRTFCGT